MDIAKVETQTRFLGSEIDYHGDRQADYKYAGTVVGSVGNLVLFHTLKSSVLN